MRSEVFVPGHITGFFDIIENADLLKTGSRGCGVVIDKGVHTELKVKSSQTYKIDVYVDGKPCDCPVTRMVVEEILTGVEEKFNVRVIHSLDVPMKQGFGTSASGALGAGIALNRILDLRLSIEEIGKIAHCSEVLNRTGLGDVIAECNGGLVIRKEAGSPGIGKVSKIPCSSYVVSWIVGKEMETKNVLKDERKKERIATAGKKCLKLLLKGPSQEKFLELSKEFALKTGLMSKEVGLVIKRLEEKGITASMIMLGNSVFTLTDDPERVSGLLDVQHITAGIDHIGPRLI